MGDADTSGLGVIKSGGDIGGVTEIGTLNMNNSRRGSLRGGQAEVDRSSFGNRNSGGESEFKERMS